MGGPSRLRGRARVLDNNFGEFISDQALPNRDPDLQTDKFKLWVHETSKNEVETAESVARAILDACRIGKITASQARQIFQEKAAGGRFLWEDVLSEFRRLGGAHTDKYFRRRD